MSFCTWNDVEKQFWRKSDPSGQKLCPITIQQQCLLYSFSDFLGRRHIPFFLILFGFSFDFVVRFCHLTVEIDHK
jgi:hypothetical protein